MIFDTTHDLSVSAPQIFKQMNVNDVAVFKIALTIPVQSVVNRIHKLGKAKFSRKLSKDKTTVSFTRIA